MKPIPIPIHGVRKALHLVAKVSQCSHEILRLAVPLVTVMVAVSREIKGRR